MKTEEEVRELKANWQADPIWDIEDTEGFEDHKDELLAFRQKCEDAWKKAAKYRNERSTKYQVDAAVDAVNYGDSEDAAHYEQAMLNYQGAIAHGILALVAELRRLNDNLEGK